MNAADSAIATVDADKGIIMFHGVPSPTLPGYSVKPDEIAALATFENLNVQEVVQYSPYDQRALVELEDTMKLTDSGSYATIGTTYLKGKTSQAIDFEYGYVDADEFVSAWL